MRGQHIRGTPYIGAGTPYHAGPGGNLGAFIAWDAATGKKVWEIKEHFPVWSGALVTAGDVVFYGTLDGWFKAVDAKTGKLLSKFKVGSGVVGNPITYRGPDGKQYVAVYAGIGGDWFLLAGDVRSDDPADVRPPSDSIQGHRTAYQPGRHRLDLRALREEKPCQPPDTSSRCSRQRSLPRVPAKPGGEAKVQATGQEVKAEDRIPAGGVLR